MESRSCVYVVSLLQQIYANGGKLNEHLKAETSNPRTELDPSWLNVWWKREKEREWWKLTEASRHTLTEWRREGGKEERRRVKVNNWGCQRGESSYWPSVILWSLPTDHTGLRNQWNITFNSDIHRFPSRSDQWPLIALHAWLLRPLPQLSPSISGEMFVSWSQLTIVVPCWRSAVLDTQRTIGFNNN